MGLALYRKYRPKKLTDVVGQDHIISTLKHALDSGSLSHAYLLTGPRGVGKTSIARILAHEMNGFEYADDSNYLDIIEIDAASNRRIDEIRDLRDKVHMAPSTGKYKIYIIDEVHMLTREAFNALLKTLEEPPAHAIFILATTEAHKVPDTIISRTQRFTFKPITIQDTTAHLRYIADTEKIKITDDALKLLAEHSSGSFRDSINLLDQLSSTNESISEETVQNSLGLPDELLVTNLYQALELADITLVLNILQAARTDGLHAAALTKHLMAKIRESFVSGNPVNAAKSLKALQQLALVQAAANQYTQLELALLQFMVSDQPAAQSVRTQLPSMQPTAKPTPEAVPVQHVKKTELSKSSAHTEEVSPKVPVKEAARSATLVDETIYWAELISRVKASHNTLYSIVRMAQPSLDNGVLTLAFNFAFHQKQMSQAATQQRIAEIASELLGYNVQVTSIVVKGTNAAAPEAPKVQQKSPLLDVSNIFEGAELLE